MSYIQDDDASQIRRLKDEQEKLQALFLDSQFSVQQEKVDSGQSTFPGANPISRGGGSGSGGQTNPEIRPRVDHGTIGLVTENIDLSVPGGNFHKMILNDDVTLAFTLLQLLTQFLHLECLILFS